MRYGPQYRDATRKRIIDAAAHLLPEYGFQALTIDRIMAEAGLTRGAFYAYFSSKAELIAASLEEAVLSHARFSASAAPQIADSMVPVAADPIDVDPAEAESSGWSLVLFAIEAARSDPEVRGAFTRMLQTLASQITQTIPRTADDPYCRAVVVLSLFAGASALARAVTDPVFAVEIQKACARVAELTLSPGS